MLSVRAITRTEQPADAISLSRLRTFTRLKKEAITSMRVGVIEQSTPISVCETESMPSVRGK